MISALLCEGRTHCMPHSLVVWLSAFVVCFTLFFLYGYLPTRAAMRVVLVGRFFVFRVAAVFNSRTEPILLR